MLVDEFPWAALLPDPVVVEFVRDFVAASRASAELGRWSILAQTIREWKATAVVHADSELLDRLSRPIDDDHGPVSDPMDG